MKIKLLACVVSAAFLTGCAASATETQPQQGNVEEEKSGETLPHTDPVAVAELSARLTQYGLAANDPLSLLNAAQMMYDAEVRVVDAEGEGSDLTRAALISSALEMAEGTENESLITAMAENAPSDRGAVTGPWRGSHTVGARGTAHLTEAFRGGEIATVAIVGNGRTDLDLFVYDENGHRICAGISMDDRERCTWRPSWTGDFRIEVRNLGSTPNRFVMTHN